MMIGCSLKHFSIEHRIKITKAVENPRIYSVKVISLLKFENKNFNK